MPKVKTIVQMCVRGVLDSLEGRLEVVRASEMTDLDARSAVRMVPRVAFGGFDSF